MKGPPIQDGKIVPCPTCPWRRTTETRRIPGGGMDHHRAEAAKGEGWTVMACHLSTDEEPVACAGFIEEQKREGVRNIGLRLALIFGKVRLEDYSDGGADLHPTMEAMLAAHPPQSEESG